MHDMCGGALHDHRLEAIHWAWRPEFDFRCVALGWKRLLFFAGISVLTVGLGRRLVVSRKRWLAGAWCGRGSKIVSSAVVRLDFVCLP